MSVPTSDCDERELQDARVDERTYWTRWLAARGVRSTCSDAERDEEDAMRSYGDDDTALGLLDEADEQQSCESPTCISPSVALPSRDTKASEAPHQVEQISTKCGVGKPDEQASHSSSYESPLAGHNEEQKTARSSHSPSPPVLPSPPLPLVPPQERTEQSYRSLRTRSVAQLRPYTLEQAKYTRSLLKNGWRGAVVALKRGHELTTDELRQRKEEANARPRDDLNGWLELAEGQQGLEESSRSTADTSRARSQMAPTSDFEPGTPGTRQWPLYSSRQRVTNYHKIYQSLLIDSDDETPSITLPLDLTFQHYNNVDQARLPKSPRHAQEQPRSGVPPKFSRKRNPSALQEMTSARKRNRVMELASSSGSERSDDSDSSEPDDDSDHERPITAVSLAGKRRKALGRMMPAVFMKKAQADLKLMAAERVEDGISGSEEDDDADLERSRSPRHLARKRIDPNCSGRQTAFKDRATFTDDSGAESDGVASAFGNDASLSEQEKEADQVSSWLHTFGPRRKSKTTHDMIDRLLTRGSGIKTKRSRIAKARLDIETKRRPLRETPGNIRQQNSRPAKIGHQEPTEISKTHLDSKQRAVPERVRPHQTSTEEQRDRHSESEGWRRFGKFSPDYGIRQLPAGLRFAPSSFIAQGDLYTLVHLTDESVRSIVLTPRMIQDVWIKDDTSLDELTLALPGFCDFVIESNASKPAEVDNLLRQLATFVTASKEMHEGERSKAVDFSKTMQEALARTDARLNRQQPVSVGETVAQDDHLLAHWRILDISARLVARYPESASAGVVSRACTTMVGRLVRSGIQQTMVRVKMAAEANTAPRDGISDTSAAIWVGLISLALSEVGEHCCWQEPQLWRTVQAEVFASCHDKGPFEVVAHELMGFAAMTLCALSQFSPAGVTSSRSRLSGDWTFMLATLQTTEKSLTEVDVPVSNTAIARRDRYLWNILARALVLIDEWNWSLDGRSDLVVKLFDLLRKRRFQNLAFETHTDIAACLQHPETFSTLVKLDQALDSAFTVLIKLVMRATLPLGTSCSGQKAVTRLLMKLSPMGSGSLKGSSFEAGDCPSVLVNHYSILLCFALIDKHTIQQRLDQARRLVNFDTADNETRKVTVRASLFFMKAFYYINVPANPVIDWISSFAAQWTTAAIDSPLIHDPMIGPEVFGLIEAFLDRCETRKTAATQTRGAEAIDHGASQDDFGSFDFDLEDPVLNQMLGVACRDQDPDVQVSALEKFIETVLVPGMFRLLSSLPMMTAPEAGIPSIADRSAFLQLVTHVWVRLLMFITKDAIATFADEYVEIWFQSIVARKLVLQHELTWTLLSRGTRATISSAALQIVVAAVDDECNVNGDPITLSWLESCRLRLLKGVISRSAHAMSPTSHAPLSAFARAALVNLHRAMLAAMKDQLSAIADVSTREEYAEFCRAVLQLVRANGGSELDERVLPEMLDNNSKQVGSYDSRERLMANREIQSKVVVPDVVSCCVQLYALNMPSSAIRAKVRQEFERNSLVDDLEAADILLHKGYQELQETVNCWKMESHVMRWFANEELPPQPDNFLDAFYLSRDDPRTVRPTA
ncbi:hypothetical protein OIO90_004420 [Microbotryomycetes sp. JL221]|nr:hypothetical protein OIO90_004420 [Microbotryomycetes sp. JL221]